MKLFFKLIAAVVLFLAVVMIAVLAYHDFFTSPKVVEKEMGPYTIATKRVVGNYAKVGPTMTEVDQQLRELGVDSTKGIGLYYDDPAKTPETELKSDVGNIIENVNRETLAAVKEKLELQEIEKQQAVVVEFPIKSPLSYVLGPMKVYPIINAYWKSKGYPENTENGYGMEIYDIGAKMMYYVMFLPR